MLVDLFLARAGYLLDELGGPLNIGHYLAYQGTGLVGDVKGPEGASGTAAAFSLRSASFLTSEATTAKPLPVSPARAASIAAFKARRLVCLAISSMMPIRDAMSFIALAAPRTALPPSLESPS